MGEIVTQEQIKDLKKAFVFDKADYIQCRRRGSYGHKLILDAEAEGLVTTEMIMLDEQSGVLRAHLTDKGAEYLINHVVEDVKCTISK